MRRPTGGNRGGAALALLGLLLAVLPLTRATADELSATAGATVDDPTLSWAQSTTVRGSGWAPGKTITVTLFSGGQVLARPIAGADGSIVATITAPSGVASSNKYRLAVQGFGGDGLYGYVTVPLTITGPTPAISIASKQLHWDEVTTVSGERYHEGSTITVSLFPENRTLATVVAGPGNTFSVPIRIPTGIRSAKDYQVAVSGEGSDRLFHLDVIQITVIGTRPAISLTSTKVARGSSVTVDGRLFLKGTNATITLVPGYEKLATAPVGTDGTFSVKVKIPGGARGGDPHAIVATGQGLDGIFAYVPVRLDLGGTVPAGDLADKTAAGVLDGTETPITPITPIRPTISTLPSAPTLPNAGNSNYLLIMLLILLLLAATVALLVVTARRDVRLRLRRGWDRATGRLRLRRGSS